MTRDDPRPAGPEDERTDDVQDPDVVGAASVAGAAGRRGFVRDTAVMSAGTALSRITGFLRLAAMAYAIGFTESRVADAYAVANITPNILYELVLGGILTSVVVPVFVEWLAVHGRDETWDVARRLFSFALVVLALVATIAAVLAPWIVDLYTSGVEEARRREVRELGTFFLRWFLPQIVFYGVGAIATGLLNAHRRFAAPMFAPILNNLIVIATFVAFGLMGGLRADGAATRAQELVLALGTTAGVVGMTLALLPTLRSTGFRFAWRTEWRHEAVRRIASLARWVVVYVAANQIGYLVVIVLATSAFQGAYPAYAAAFILFQLPHAIFAVSIFTALLPAMSERWAVGDAAGFRERITEGIRATAAIVIPASLGYLVLARPIVRLLLEHGVVEPRSGRLVADLLVAFAVGLFPFSVFQLLLRASYAMQDTRTPALVNVAALVVNVAADLILFFGFDLGVQGLALGHAASYVFASMALAVLVRRRVGRLGLRSIADGVGRTLIAGGATAGVAWVVARLLADALGTTSILEQTIQVVGAVGAGLVVFVVAATLLRIEEVAAVRRRLVAHVHR